MVKCIVLWVCGRQDLWLNNYVWCVVGVWQAVNLIQYHQQLSEFWQQNDMLKQKRQDLIGESWRFSLVLKLQLQSCFLLKVLW